MEKLLKIVIEIVQEVGNLLLKWREDKIFDGKWEGTQFKAKVDKMAHIELIKRLKKLKNDIPIISEEDESVILNKPICYWLVDPIDGTASFINGYDGFVTQVALMRNYRPELSVVYAPALREIYWAIKDFGAFLNDKKIKVKHKTKAEILIDNYPEPTGMVKFLYEELNLNNYIECGSISLKICKVASGNADIFFKPVIVKDWDIAPAHLIIEEAGGILKDIKGSDIKYEDNNEYDGIIAAVSESILTDVVNWYNNFQIIQITGDCKWEKI